MVQTSRGTAREKDLRCHPPRSFLLLVVFVVTHAADRSRRINLPTSKSSDASRPRLPRPHQQLSRDHRAQPRWAYAALLNQGYGTQETGARQSIAILDLSNNQLHDFPDDRLSDEYSTRQSYFIGLAFSSDGKHLYASMGSITDPTGEKPTSTGNGIAVYKFADGQVTPERFIKIAPQPIAEGKEVAFGLRKTPAGTALPYPAGLAVLPGPRATACSSPTIFLTTPSCSTSSSGKDREVIRSQPQPLYSERLSVHGDCQQSRDQSLGQLVEHVRGCRA